MIYSDSESHSSDKRFRETFPTGNDLRSLRVENFRSQITANHPETADPSPSRARSSSPQPQNPCRRGLIQNIIETECPSWIASESNRFCGADQNNIPTQTRLTPKDLEKSTWTEKNLKKKLSGFHTWNLTRRLPTYRLRMSIASENCYNRRIHSNDTPMIWQVQLFNRGSYQIDE